MPISPYTRCAMNSPTPTAMVSVAWSLTNEKSVLPGMSTSSPAWTRNGRGRSTTARIGMLASSATPAASGAQTRPATAPGASGRLRAPHQAIRHSTASAAMRPYSPTNFVARLSHSGASFARPLMPSSTSTSGFDPSIASPAICRGPLPFARASAV